MAKSITSQTMSGPVFLIMTGFTCNNNCLMCSVKPKGINHQPRDTQEITADMKQGRRLCFDRIEFTGGEPTMRTDLLQLIAQAKKLGYREIAISTNCRTLSHLDFLKSLQQAGLNRITSTLYGYNPSSHEAVTRAPGSFKLTTQGITNSLGLNITTSVNTVVFSLTAPFLAQTGSLLASLGVKYWTLLDLIPDGYALLNYNSYSLPPKQLTLALGKISPLLEKFTLVNLMDFPYCLLPPKLLSQPNCALINARARTEIINQVGYQPKRFHIKNRVYYDLHKLRSRRCRQCAYNHDCGGTWTPYFELYTDSFIRPFLKKFKP